MLVQRERHFAPGHPTDRIGRISTTRATSPEDGWHSKRKQDHPLGTRNSFTGIVATGRPGWSQGRGEEAASWFLAASPLRGYVTRARGMFCGEIIRPSGTMNIGPHATLAASQVAVETQIRLYDRTGRAALMVLAAPGRRTARPNHRRAA